jgi:hypothetical protein
MAAKADGVEDEGDKAALDMAVPTFTERQAARQPPKKVSPQGLRRRPNGRMAGKGAFLVRGQRLIPGSRQWRPAPMAMTMNGEVQLSATRDKVWTMLNDPEVLKVCIPGCEMLDKNSDTEFQAIATVKVGPVKARWKGKVKLTDLDPPNGYRIVGEGEGGVAGFAKGNAKVSLADKDGGTLLSYDVEAQIGGKLAQLGQRLINSAAKKTADDFFVKFAAAVAPK